jgi:hypothetical protein
MRDDNKRQTVSGIGYEVQGLKQLLHIAANTDWLGALHSIVCIFENDKMFRGARSFQRQDTVHIWYLNS